jgi:DNA-binding MarR family transcriptional regulator
MAKSSSKTVTTRTRKTRKAKAAAQPATKIETKQATVLKLLRRQDGASIQEIIDATGWQPHSARGFLTAAVKKRLGISVISEKGEDGIRRYYAAASAP